MGINKRYVEELSSRHKRDIFKILDQKKRRLLYELAGHDRSSVAHSFNVADDCVFVAERLDFSEKQVEQIYLAALLHDVGKIGMHAIVLDQGVDKDEQERIMDKLGIEKGGNPLAKIKMWQLVKYRSHYLHLWDRKHINSKEVLSIMNFLGDQAYVSVLEHIRHHQEYGRVLLRKAGVDGAIIEIAMTHHPEYLKNPSTGIEIDILSAVDKFNAMIHSEGIRKHTKRLERSQALTLLVEKLKQKYEVVRELGRKHLPIEERELDLMAAKIISDFREHKRVSELFVETVVSHLISWLNIVKKLGFWWWFKKRKVRKDLDKIEEGFELAYAEGRIN